MADRLRIGYALAPKKEKSFIQPSLRTLASSKGIDLVKIEPSIPLIDQGPFDCILHKLSGEDWRAQLAEYLRLNPDSLVIDPLEDISRLHNRVSMLEAVAGVEVTRGEAVVDASFGVPEQIVIYDQQTLTDRSKWSDSLKFPVIAKPLVADGTAKSHKMSLVFNQEGLNKLKPPIVLQEFINHGGVIFKVFVVGDYVKCMKRKSLPDVSEEKSTVTQSSLSFSQVSNMNTSQKNADSYCKIMHLEDTQMPPEKLIREIATGLRKSTRLHLFNFDVIRNISIGNRYLVVDINYFPGYAKMPSYEAVLTDFFLGLLKKKDLGSDDKIIPND